MFRCLFHATGVKKALPANGRGADNKDSEGQNAQKGLPRIASGITFRRRDKKS